MKPKCSSKCGDYYGTFLQYNAAVKKNEEGVYSLKGSDIPDRYLRKKQKESVNQCVEYVECVFFVRKGVQKYINV